MQPTPPEMQDSTDSIPTTLTTTESLGPTPIYLTPPNSQSSFSNTPNSTDFMDDVTSSTCFPEPDNEEIEEIERHDEELLALLYQPPLDDCTREMSQLDSLRYYIQGSPVNIWHWYELFPNITDHVFSVSLGSGGLRHSLLAVSAAIRDLFSNTLASEFYLVEKAASLRLLQEAIASDLVDEALAISVIMHIAMDVLLGQLRHTRRHLQGLYLIFEQLKQRAKETGQPLSPLALVIQRMCIRLDFSLISIYGESTLFKSLEPTAELQDRQWLIQTRNGVSKDMTSSNIEWTLASFEIDNLMHRAYNAAKRSQEYRESNDPLAEETIQLEYRKLMQGMEMWKQRSIVRMQEEIEQYARQVSKPADDPSLRFLYHEPLYLQNVFYAKLLNQWRMLSIWNSLIVHPLTGPEPLSHGRYQLAVEICRTHAAMGSEGYVGPSWQCLFFAGMVFGGKKRYPLESEWILDRLREVAMVFPTLRPVVEAMPTLWERERSHWYGFAELYRSTGLMDA